MPVDKKIPVVELFGPTLQGEGALAGQVSCFVRTGGCGFRCVWCDSLHAVLPEQIKKHATMMYQQEIFKRINELVPNQINGMWVTLTGGDPVMWDLSTLVTSLQTVGYRIAVETQGQLWKEWLAQCNLVTCSPKGPSSGMADKFDRGMLRFYQANIPRTFVLKFVIFGEEDLAWAEEVKASAPDIPVYLSAGTPSNVRDVDLDGMILEQYRWLTDAVLGKPKWHGATVLPQLHTLLWGRKLGH